MLLHELAWHIYLWDQLERAQCAMPSGPDIVVYRSLDQQRYWFDSYTERTALEAQCILFELLAK
jgi:hypothetical protein